MSRVGVFVCHCGKNIASTVDVVRVAEEAGKMPGVVHSVEYVYMCSDPGQEMVRSAIREKNLDGVVVAACSPEMHEKTFRRAAAQAGLNPFLLEITNVREHVSWVHSDRRAATEKAIDLVRATVERVKRNRPLTPIKVPITPRALVIGGGVAGIQAALDIADAGHEVVLLERSPSIGGHMAQLSETFPTLDCSQCILTPRMVECASHPKIQLMTYSELESLDGYIGNFTATIRRKARFVDPDKCTGCGLCSEKCPSRKTPSEFDAGLSTRKSIYTPFPQAVPNIPVIDRDSCLYFKTGKCKICEKVCYTDAIRFDQEDEIVEVDIGAVVVATGFDLYTIDKKPETSPYKGYGEYGYGKIPDVIDGLTFERMASASGPTAGEFKRPSDGKVPETVVFVACVGSRAPEKGIDYCSKICCMYTAKHAMLYKHKCHDGRAIVFYMDIRSGGKTYDEFVRRAIEEDGVVYYRGRVSRIYEEKGKLVVLGADTLAGRPVRVEADMVVLATAIAAQQDAPSLAQKLAIQYDRYGFFSEKHPKLAPIETNTAGIYLAGACQGPRDIPDTVAQASGTGAKVAGLFSNRELTREPVVARVDSMACDACFFCVDACPYGAIERVEIKDAKGNVIKEAARVNEGKCQGCGVCLSVCRPAAIDLDGYRDEEIFAEIHSLG